MNSENAGAPRAEILGALEREFQKHKASGGKQTPAELQRLAISALEKGCRRVEVALAAGVSPKTIGNWRAAARPKAKRLRVVSDDAPVRCEREPQRAQERICARLASGVELEISRAALDEALLSMLANLGVR